MWIYAVPVTVVMAGALLGWIPRWPGLAHEVALPPLDLIADIRVLTACAPSTWTFVVGVVVMLVVRAAILAAVLGFTWRRFRFTLRFYVAALVPALLGSGLDFSGRAILYAYLIWGGLLVTVVTFFVLGSLPWMGADTLHASFGVARRERFRFGALCLFLVLLAIIGTAWRRPGEAVQVLIVPVSGALTAAMALWLSAPPRHRRVSRGLAIAATAGVVVLFAATFAIARSGYGSRRATPVHRTGSLMLVPGVDTSTGNGALFQFDPHAIGYSCAQTFYFSYVGPGPGGPQGAAQCPIRRGAPYRKADTTRPLHLLTEALRAQLRHIPRPVLIVTHSQGAWIAWAEITTSREPSVQTLLMLAPFNEGLAPYPAPGADGAGVVGGDAVRLVTDIGRSLGISQFDPDAPLARELQGTPGAVRKLVARALPRHVRAAAVLARADLPLEPKPWPHHLTEACPGWLTHAALPTSSHVTSTINGFLDGRDPPACATWIAALGHSADAFGAPPPDP